MLTTLVACGGGDGDLTGGGSDDPDPITLSLVKSDGDLSGDNDITISASVMQGSTPLSGKLVTFSLTGGTETRAIISSSSQATENDGIAIITVQATGLSGGVEVTATVTDAESDVLSFNSTGGGLVVAPPVEGPAVDSISLFASSQQLASSGAQTVMLTAIAKDVNNNLLEGASISFSSDSGSIEKILDDSGQSSDLTGPDGKISRNLSTLAEPTNRIITVTVTSGDVSDTLEVQVVGTVVTLTGSSSLALNDANNYIIKVLDSDGTGLATTLVSLSLSNQSTETPAGNVASITLPETVMTDFNGQATVSVIGTSGGTNSIIATALGTSVEKEVAVQADSFLFTNFGDGSNNVNPSTSTLPDILLSKTATVTLTWLRSGVAVPDGTNVSFTTTRGTLASTSVTTVGGKATTTLTSTNAGKALLTFTGTDTVSGKEIELNNQLEFEFVADSADRLIAQAFPSSISPNGQTSTISVVVRDASGNLVKNKTVDFVLNDTNGGSIFPASAVTDSNGSASTVYTSASTSAEDDVEIAATVRDMPTATDTATLTVADREVFIALGTGNTIENVDETTYNKKYSVFVTDIDSNPVSNVTLTVSAIPSAYIKGVWVAVLKDGEFDHYATQPSVECANEDLDNDGILSGAEDTNSNGQLTPGNIVNALGEITTDEQGRAIIDITYAEVFGHWAYIDLLVSTKVSGTESFAKALFVLPVAGEDVTVEANPPASFLGGTSPFGSAGVCTDAN
jgi:hypothetical protein